MKVAGSRGLFASIFFAVLLACTPRSKMEDAPSKASAPSQTSLIPALCKELDSSIQKYKWGLKTCGDVEWKADRVSIEGRPLIWAEFGDPSSANKTLILSMVHPDEITPLYLGFQLVHWVKEHVGEFKDAHVIIAPFVNPDGHFKKPPVRLNARGVDVNRNFPTKDWSAKALQIWKGRLRSNPRRFPGHEASSEPETHFQEELIARFQPKKILSFHSPLNVTDYDGPSSLTLDKFPKEYVQECLKLRNRLRAQSTGFFPGSLGNYAGQEMGIPTITLELPSSDSRKAAHFWKVFQPGIHSMIDFKLKDDLAKRDPAKRNVTR